MSDPVKYLEQAWHEMVSKHYDTAMEAWRAVQPEHYNTEEEYFQCLLGHAVAMLQD